MTESDTRNDYSPRSEMTTSKMVVDISKEIARCREIKAMKAGLKAKYHAAMRKLDLELRAREQRIRRTLAAAQ